ncbi:MAG: 4-hydroxythreonine-4-phosphate dehydrogenase PdxA [Steroidobacteraceae bacterium]
MTAGEPAGIGPDICLDVARRELDCELVCFASADVLEARARALGHGVRIERFDPKLRRRHQAGVLQVLDLPYPHPTRAGIIEPRNAPQLLATLQQAVVAVRDLAFDALVTAPVNKAALSTPARVFHGHTEFIAQLCGASQPVMLLVGGGLRVALATTHLPLREVASAICAATLERILAVLDDGLRRHFAIARPRLAVCGLNPHAGESGQLGDEETAVIAPAVHAAASRGIDVAGPFPADTIFVPDQRRDFDAILAMYHDQGLPVLKAGAFGAAVNVTLGLPIIRTSVDHGTALSLAATGRASSGSLLAAIETALDMARQTA